MKDRKRNISSQGVFLKVVAAFQSSGNIFSGSSLSKKVVRYRSYIGLNLKNQTIGAV